MIKTYETVRKYFNKAVDQVRENPQITVGALCFLVLLYLMF